MTAVAIMVKTPGLSPVKTRLAAGLGRAGAATFHGLAAAAIGSVAAGMISYWAVAEADADGWQDRPRLWQGEGGLGARMARVYDTLLRRHGRVLLVGADSPQTTPALLRLAAETLDDTPFVLGPALDGGFWLFGGRLPVPDAVWQSVRYSAPDTGARFLDSIRPLGSVSLTAAQLDADRADDLPVVLAALRALPDATAAQRALAEWLDARGQVPVLELNGPALLFGGPYSNLQATQALFTEAARLGIPPARMVCTGDVVAYGADAAATATLVRQSGAHVVMGNCEEQLAAGADDCGCGFTAGSLCDRLSAAWFAHADATLDAASRAWMSGLPRRIDLSAGNRRIAVMHGDAERINAFVLPSTPAATLDAQLAAAAADGFVGGYCGLPFTRLVEERLWHNPGAIGLPANDGTPRGWFSIVSPECGTLRVSHHALHYDHVAAAAAIGAAGLAGGYAAALETGLWPSTDVLGPAERAQGGVPITPGLSSQGWRPC